MLPLLLLPLLPLLLLLLFLLLLLLPDMGGMGYIQSNHSTILYNNTMISFNAIEASRRNNIKRLFYASSACIYPEHIQDTVDVAALKESDAW